MRTRPLLLHLALLSVVFAAAPARAQDEFTVVRRPQYLSDSNNQPWSDLTCQLRVRLHPEYTKDLPASEVTATGEGGNSVTFNSGTPKIYALRKEDKTGRTYAMVDWVVYKDPNKQVVYQIGLYNPATKSEVSALRQDGTKVVMRNDKATNTFTGRDSNSAWSIVKANWPVVVGVMLLGLLLGYFVVFRWLFAGLLRRQWRVGSAENLTWAMFILVLLGFLTGLGVYLLGMRVETYALMILTGVSLLLVVLVGLVSGSKTA